MAPCQLSRYSPGPIAANSTSFGAFIDEVADVRARALAKVSSLDSLLNQDE
jgi:hypothetical protein